MTLAQVTAPQQQTSRLSVISEWEWIIEMEVVNELPCLWAWQTQTEED